MDKFAFKGKNDMPICYLICGFIGSGKTTYSKRLALETHAVHLNVDEWCMRLFPQQEYEQNWDECFMKTIQYLWEKAGSYAQKKQSIIFDMGFWTKQGRKQGIKIARKLGFIPRIHYVYAPDNILKERIAQRKGMLADYNLKNFDKIKQNFENPGLFEKCIKIKNY